MHGYEFYVDPSRCIGCQSCENACEECETHRGHSMINFDFIDRQGDHRNRRLRLLALRRAHMHHALPRRCNQEGRRWHSAVFVEAPLYRLLELRPRLPFRYRFSEDCKESKRKS